jgi:ABC-2 type transport system permease protein
MMASVPVYQPDYETGELRAFLTVLLATARAEIERRRAYLIEIVRWPLFPVIYFLTLLLTYRVSGQPTAGGYNIEGFLLIGAIGMVVWSSTIWSGGYAIEIERTEGTINSLFLTPCSRAAVIMGYGLGSFAIFILPGVAALTILGVLTGARFDVQSPAAVALAGFALVFGALALGHVLAGGFVLTRRANLWANFLQTPVYLLSGMVVPVSELPDWLGWFATIFPIGAGMTALRDSLLSGAGVGDIASPLLSFGISSLVLVVAGSLLLRRVENVAKRGDTFDLD